MHGLKPMNVDVARVQQGSRCLERHHHALGMAMAGLKTMNVDVARVQQGSRCLEGRDHAIGGTVDGLETMNGDVVLRMEQGALRIGKESGVKEQRLEGACRNSCCVCELRLQRTIFRRKSEVRRRTRHRSISIIWSMRPKRCTVYVRRVGYVAWRRS